MGAFLLVNVMYLSAKYRWYAGQDIQRGKTRLQAGMTGKPSWGYGSRDGSTQRSNPGGSTWWVISAFMACYILREKQRD